MAPPVKRGSQSECRMSRHLELFGHMSAAVGVATIIGTLLWHFAGPNGRASGPVTAGGGGSTEPSLNRTPWGHRER